MTMKINLEDIRAAATLVYGVMPPTPQYRWPLLCERLGTDVWVKHENHTPVGAFKIRGGLVYFSNLGKLALPLPIPVFHPKASALFFVTRLQKKSLLHTVQL